MCKFYISALVGIIIEWLDNMHGVTMKISGFYVVWSKLPWITKSVASEFSVCFFSSVPTWSLLFVKEHRSQNYKSGNRVNASEALRHAYPCRPLHRIYVKCFRPFAILHTAEMALQSIAVVGRSVVRMSTGCRINKLVFTSWFDLITLAKCGTIRLPMAVSFRIIIRCFRKIAQKKKEQVRHVCPSVRKERLRSHWTHFHEILHLKTSVDVWNFH